MNNTITERDKIEISSFWVYQNLQADDTFTVNNKKFKIIDDFHYKK